MLAKRKGVTARRRLKAAWSKTPRPDEQKPDIRPSRPDERTTDREVLIHQGPGVEIRQVCGEGDRTDLGRPAPGPEPTVVVEGLRES